MRPIDSFLTVFKAGLAIKYPEAGAVFAAMCEFLPSAHDDAIQRANDYLQDRLCELEDRIDETVVTRNEFADLFKNTLATVQRTHYDEKIRAAVNVLANACLSDDDSEKLSYIELDHFSRAVEQLSIGAFAMVRKLVLVHESHNRIDRGIDIEHLCDDFTPGVTIDRELGLGLLRELESFNIAIVDQANVTFNKKRMATGLLTTLGYKFHRHIMEGNHSPRPLTH